LLKLIRFSWRSVFVGVILPDAASSNRWETADRGFLQAAFDAAGVKVDIQNANGDKATIRNNCRPDAYSWRKGSYPCKPRFRLQLRLFRTRLQHRVLKTIDYDRLTLNGSASYYVSFDNEAVGRLQGEGIKACLDAAGKKNARIVYLNGSPTDNNATLFKAGYDFSTTSFDRFKELHTC